MPAPEEKKKYEVGEHIHDQDVKKEGSKHESKPLNNKNKEQKNTSQNQVHHNSINAETTGPGESNSGIVDLSHLSDDDRSRYLINLMQGSTAGSRESEMLHLMQNSNPYPKERERLQQMEASIHTKVTGHPGLDRLHALVADENSLMGNFTDFPDGQAALLLSNLSKTEQQRLLLNNWLCERLFHELNSQLTAAALADFDITLVQKLQWIAYGNSSGKVEYQYIRPLLLQGDKRAKAIETFLSSQVGLDQDVYVTSLIHQLQAPRLDLTKINTGSGFFSTPVDEVKHKIDPQEFTLGDADTADRVMGMAGESLEDLEEGDKQAFLELFEQNALLCATALLDESENAIQKEHRQITKQGVDDIQAAIQEQASEFTAYEAIQKEQYEATKKAGSGYGTAHVAASFQKRIAAQEKQIRKSLMATHPVFGDESLPFFHIYDFYENANTDAFQAFLQQSLGEKYENIQKTKANLREDPSMVWSLEKIIQLTSHNIPLLDDPIYSQLATKEFERRRRNDAIIKGAMAALSIGLAIASFGSMSGVSAIILGGLSVGVSGIDAYMTYEEYDKIAPAGNTTFDPEKVLSDEDPSVIWVIASAAAIIGDGVQLIKLAKQFSTLTKVNKALELQNLETVTAKLAGKIPEKELANLKENLQLLEGIQKTRQQLAHSIVKQSKDKLDLPAIEQAVDIYLLQHAEELIKTTKSGSFKPSKQAQQEVLGVYKMTPEGKLALKNTISGKIQINEITIAKALENSNMKTIQGEVSLPMIKRYVKMLENGLNPPPIKVANGIIIEGNHRYVAGRLFGKEPEVIPSILPLSQASRVVPIQNTKVSQIDWGGY